MCIFIRYCVLGSFVHSPTKNKACNNMKVLHLPRSLKIMVLYENECIAS